ncbi:hypothetical protein MLOOGBEN_00390 [Bacillus sp. EB106-08-02-XG196]|uniref:hypothetical protein n=1 Tax=Bacillus sp. EB106-08-02-XG196 TaxID=2737049 RepID=UPI0015C4DF38|nr:hypothetical protein [Bacillus sp. EB106-08-02-XG196]NWQ39152.1 hypothetical protein [Bacillus sp. EB106-08-02-XG196]
MKFGYQNDLNRVDTKLNTLTSFRFIGALLVFIFHAGLLKDYKTGFLGVSFFFVLSGFILVYNYSALFEGVINNKEL